MRVKEGEDQRLVSSISMLDETVEQTRKKGWTEMNMSYSLRIN